MKLSSNQLFILLAATTIALFAFVVAEETRPRPAASAPVFAPPASESAPEPEPQDETENLPRDEVLRGWKVYRTEAHGFEFRYSQDWYISECPDLSCIRVAPRLRPLQSDAPFQGLIFGGPSKYHTPEEDRDESCNQDFSEIDLGSRKVKTLGCHGGIRVYFMNERTGEMTVVIMVTNNPKDYGIAIKTLSTFRFLE